MKNKKQLNNPGFTLIELLVVIAIIALLSSIALIGFLSARQKSRDAKRLADMTQMNTALELYYSYNRGYPSSPIPGIPGGVVPTYAASLPSSPLPADGTCGTMTYNAFDSVAPAGVSGTVYYYYPSGTTYIINGITLYPDFSYYFCLGNQTGNFSGGMHKVNPKGVR